MSAPKPRFKSLATMDKTNFAHLIAEMGYPSVLRSKKHSQARRLHVPMDPDGDETDTVSKCDTHTKVDSEKLERVAIEVYPPGHKKWCAICQHRVLHEAVSEDIIPNGYEGAVVAAIERATRSETPGRGYHPSTRYFAEVGREELHTLYWGEALSAVKIAEHFDVSESTVYARMHEWDIPRRTNAEWADVRREETGSLLSRVRGASWVTRNSPKEWDPDPEDLRRWYCEYRLSGAEIAEWHDVTPPVVYNRLRKHDIELRTSPEGTRLAKDKARVVAAEGPGVYAYTAEGEVFRVDA